MAQNFRVLPEQLIDYLTLFLSFFKFLDFFLNFFLISEKKGYKVNPNTACMYVCKEEGVQVFVGAAAPAVRMAHLHT